MNNKEERWVVFHSFKCKRKEGGDCSFCTLAPIKMSSKYKESWVGTTGDTKEWGDKASNMFGYYNEKEFLWD